MTIQFGLIGGGVMGEALLARIIAQQVYPANAILVSDPSAPRRAYLTQTYGVNVTTDNQQVMAATKAILLAIKPQIFAPVVAGLQLDQPSETIVMSILAGTPLQQLETAFSQQPVVRVMPNTPAQVGAGMSAIAGGKLATPAHLATAKQILATVGAVVEVPESMLDAVTGLSGSGPGYVALIVEAMADGGVAAGLPRPIAMQLAIQTVLGTATLLQETGMHPGQLKDQVTSPGGTTIAGIAHLEQQGMRSALIEAVRTATNRAKELGKQ
ncbi:pyrroline-5-carboxylate reductase [filamentous cyanobacterium LEGE 11480]|uniref:Pyrroline-5-carboxylate reductase n=1 Tax=Romeriopsis navalis LEGE 11480 TaxID=2777977 RepID=A0A928VQK9_9CYAN|nr:pyrroline-5-carboxylate reductase [Romeriopsis navalis]MBE9030299.1 pyrroline-5-carboxylate reductase [Romeriopsis navalis LEGE 11480]